MSDRPKMTHVPGNWKPEDWWTHVEECPDCSRFYERPPVPVEGEK